MRLVDIVILSYARNSTLKKVTEDAISSLLASENPNDIKFSVLVIESNKSLQPYNYPGTKTIYPKDKFGFNHYLNIGLQNTQNEFVCFCNNDLIFHRSWASAIITQFDTDSKLVSASPLCSVYHPTIGFRPDSGNYYGYGVRQEIAGWCFFVRRSLFDTIGLFDEKFKFWFADADYAKTLQKFNQKHALVTSSIVDHLDGVSTTTLDAQTKLALTAEQYWYFQYKWEHHSWPLYIYRNFRSKLRIKNKGE
jgi:GT2 family glycosyltransferase